jgi:hypothetical protein
MTKKTQESRPKRPRGRKYHPDNQIPFLILAWSNLHELTIVPSTGIVHLLL